MRSCEIVRLCPAASGRTSRRTRPPLPGWVRRLKRCAPSKPPPDTLTSRTAVPEPAAVTGMAMLPRPFAASRIVCRRAAAGITTGPEKSTSTVNSPAGNSTLWSCIESRD